MAIQTMGDIGTADRNSWVCRITEGTDHYDHEYFKLYVLGSCVYLTGLCGEDTDCSLRWATLSNAVIVVEPEYDVKITRLNLISSTIVAHGNVYAQPAALHGCTVLLDGAIIGDKNSAFISNHVRTNINMPKEEG